MPFSMATMGNHTDDMHADSAKRDTVSGVAGLNASGDLLSLHDTLYIPRSIADKAIFADRTSLDEYFHVERLGSRDMIMQIDVASSLETMLNTSMKNANSGYAGLDTRGYLTPDIYPYAFLTTDLSFGVTHPMITASVNGNGTVADDTALGGFYAKGGASLIGYGVFQYNRHLGVRSYATGLSFDIFDMYGGAGGVRYGYLGAKLDFTTIDRLQCIMIEQASDGSCNFITGGASASTVTSITTLSSRASVQIGFKTGVAVCAIDGVIEAVHTTNLPTDNAMHAGIASHSDASVTTNLVYNIAGFNVSRSG